MTDTYTLGEMFNHDRDFKVQTIELPWVDNEKRISCIPAGLYLCQLGMYNKGGYPAYEIMNVPDRSEIKIHIANYLKDILGCIGLGLTRDATVPAVWNSKKAFNQFMDYLDGDPFFELDIREQ
jgi:hypothetical protein